jgi:hypothetical protein
LTFMLYIFTTDGFKSVQNVDSTLYFVDAKHV